MKKFTLVAIAAASLFVVGCNKTEDTGTTPDPSASGKMSPAPSPAMSPETTASTTPATSDAGGATGGATGSVGGVTEADLGVPFYPGSEEKPNMSAKAEVGGKATATAVRSTKDTPEKVVAFYKEAITKAGYEVKAATTANGMGSVVGMKGQDSISVTCTKDTTGSDNMVSVVNAKSK